MTAQRITIRRSNRVSIFLVTFIFCLFLSSCGGSTDRPATRNIKNSNQIRGVWALQVEDRNATEFHGPDDSFSSWPDASLVLFADGGFLLDVEGLPPIGTTLPLSPNPQSSQHPSEQLSSTIDGPSLRLRRGDAELLSLLFLKDDTFEVQSASDRTLGHTLAPGRRFWRVTKETPEIQTDLANRYIFDGTLARYNGDLSQEKQTTHVTVYYADSGTPYYAGPWRAGKFHGQGRIFYRSGVLREIGRWEHGLKAGAFKTYSPDGRLLAEGECAGGKENGPWVFYFRSGRVRERVTCQDGHPEGEYKSYWLNGRPRFSGLYHKMFMSDLSTIEGEGTLYYESGVRQYEGAFHRGLFHGAGSYFNERGQRVYEGNWENGERAG